MKRVPKPSPVPPAAFDLAAPLSPFIIRKLAGRKGLTVDSVMEGKGGMRFVSLADGKSGELVDNPGKYRGFTLAEAKRHLEQLPDRFVSIGSKLHPPPGILGVVLGSACVSCPARVIRSTTRRAFFTIAVSAGS